MKYTSKLKFITTVSSIALLFVQTTSIYANTHEDETTSSSYYEVVDGKVDAKTFVGYNAYESACIRCHGVGAEGTDIAPSLIEGVSKLSPAEFRLKVLHQYAMKFTPDDRTQMENAMLDQISKQEKRDSGEIETMPKWQNNPVIQQNVGNIYRYLKARADGVIGTGKPGLLKQ